MLRQILGCRTQQVIDGQQLPPDQAGRRMIGDANRQVDMIVDQIHLAILEQQFHIHLGVTPQKLRHVRVYHESPHRLGHADADQPLGFIGELAADFHHRPGGVDHLLATLEHLFATVAQAQLACGSLQ
ncbi:hypothetical protein D3C73_1290830 [compost metagenome]